MDLQLTDQVAVVTAASKGLGRAAARQLAREGARLVMSARSQVLEQAAAEIRAETGATIRTIRADVTVPDDIEELIEKTVAEFGRLDILVINAGGPPSGGFLDLTVVDWEAAIQLTLMSAVRLCYEAVPHMLQQGGGSIVAIESISIRQPIDNLILSNSIRLAVVGMLKSLANELGPQGIRVNTINPTFTWTGRVEQLLADRAASKGTTVEEEKDKTVAGIPLGRVGDVEGFGRAVAWLASPAAGFIHGHNLMFDGGATRATV
ncbi:MAG: SDR family oxidoreductase [Candidatus Promineifilaceae bacterium]|nr:SDR family oxidoreductase [Candidatus Promineifilaceae bacterium]